MNSVALFALIFAFGAVEMATVNFQAQIDVKCDNGATYRFTETGNGTSPDCQGTMQISEITEYKKGKSKTGKAKLISATAGKEEDMIVYSPVNEAISGPDTGAKMENTHVFSSLNTLQVCGGKELVVKTDDIWINIIKDGKTAKCTGSAVITGQKACDCS